jgi:FAD/FMN-containing dehydrogenase
MSSQRADREPLVQPGQIEHHVADLSATFAADVTLAQAQAKLRENNQWLPIDGAPNATLGSLVEQNSTGPLRLGFGAWRDLLLGAQFRNGAGELITAGGRTVKNVAGYDLTKFMVGQYGIFGKIITLTTRAYCAPDFAMIATFDPDVKTVNRLLVTPCRPMWAILTADALRCGYFGDSAAMEFYAKHLPQQGAKGEFVRCSIDREIETRDNLWRSESDGHSFRASVPPSKIDQFIRASSPKSWRADAAFGVVIGACDASARDSLHKAASSAGGSVITFDPTGRPQNLSITTNVANLLHRLKNSFDPNGKLNPLPLSTS